MELCGKARRMSTFKVLRYVDNFLSIPGQEYGIIIV